jgi:hypothetical protein
MRGVVDPTELEISGSDDAGITNRGRIERESKPAVGTMNVESVGVDICTRSVWSMDALTSDHQDRSGFRLHRKE